MSAATIPPASFMGATGGGVTGSLRQPPTSQPQPTNTSNEYQGVAGPLTDSAGQPIDTQSLFMFTTVGYVGLHFVLRPLFRWGMRSLALPAKSYYNDKNSKSSKSKSKSKLKSKSTKSPSNNDNNSNNIGEMDDTVVTTGGNNTDNNENNTNNSDNNTSKSPTSSLSILKRRRKRVLLCNASTGPCSAYGEVVATFGALTAISTFAHPQNVLLYFGVLYPSYPFILRFIQTLNDKKSKVTMARTTRLASKALFTTGGFALSMVFVGYYLQTIPFLNVIGLTFWDCLADMLISDGPDRPEDD